MRHLMQITQCKFQIFEIDTNYHGGGGRKLESNRKIGA